MDKIQIEKVLEDMDNPDGGMVSHAAKDYFDLHYKHHETEVDEYLIKEIKRSNIKITALILSMIIGIIYIILKIKNYIF